MTERTATTTSLYCRALLSLARHAAGARYVRIAVELLALAGFVSAVMNVWKG